MFSRKYINNNLDILSFNIKKTPLLPPWLALVYLLTDPFMQNVFSILSFGISSVLIGTIFGFAISLIFFIIGLAPLYIWLKANRTGTCLPKNWSYGPSNIEGKNVMITGANCGMGLAAAEQILKWKPKTLIIACRDMSKGRNAIDKLKGIKDQNEIKTELTLVELDLSTLASVKSCAEKVNSQLKDDGLNILMNNAGVMMCPFTTSKDGNELQWATNHLGHFYLTNLLLDVIKKAGTETSPSRIICYASLGHHFPGLLKYTGQAFSASMIPYYLKTVSPQTYNPVYAYGVSKLSNILFASALQKKLAGENVKVYSVHPGGVKTELTRHTHDFPKLIEGFMLKTAIQGAQTALYCATAPHTILKDGEYYSECRLTATAPEAKDLTIEDEMWELSESYLKKAGF